MPIRCIRIVNKEMIYIIDGNNLAGKLKMLKEKDFDRKLAALLKDFVRSKGIEVLLVFDGSDPMGDRAAEGQVTRIYTPRDSYYKSADDKIIELVKRIGAPEADGEEFWTKETFTLISDDREIIEAGRRRQQETGRRLEIVTATDFANRLRRRQASPSRPAEKADSGKEKLEPRKKKEITDELSKLWQ